MFMVDVCELNEQYAELLKIPDLFDKLQLAPKVKVVGIENQIMDVEARLSAGINENDKELVALTSKLLDDIRACVIAPG